MVFTERFVGQEDKPLAIRDAHHPPGIIEIVFTQTAQRVLYSLSGSVNLRFRAMA